MKKKFRLIHKHRIWYGFLFGVLALGSLTIFITYQNKKEASETIPNLAFVFTGESNAGGQALNTSATTEELDPREQVQILNNNSLTFEPLDIGTNNNIGHYQITCCATHGFELELANKVVANTFPNNPTIHLVKTGQGSSKVAQWDPDWSEPTISKENNFWTKFTTRTSFAKTQLGANTQWVVWVSLGINDFNGLTPINTYKSSMIAYINNIKADLPGAIIVLTQFQSMIPADPNSSKNGLKAFNDTMAEIAESENNVYVIDSTGASLKNDGLHWNYDGMKTVTDRLIDKTKEALDSSSTYYVRTDGGTATQCTGLADSPYTSGTNQPCAWNNPMIALPTSGTARIAAGDTLIVSSGEYQITSELVVPAGTSKTNKTIVMGTGSSKPILWGSGGLLNVINLKNNSFIELSFLEVTDHSSCGRDHPYENIKCVTASNQNDRLYYAQNGINAIDSNDVYINDLYIHGLSAAGFYTGGISDWTVENTQIISNSFVGFDLDSVDSNKKNNPELLDSGTLTFNNLKIEWTGCSESYPDKTPQYCTPIGVNADGMGAGATKGTFKFTNSEMSHNMSDGLDLLYAGDIGESTIVLDRFKAEGNLGNQVKVNANAKISNSVIIGNCNFFRKFNGSYTDESKNNVFNDCRGGDVPLVLSHVSGETAELTNNTIINVVKTVVTYADKTYEKKTATSAGNIISFNPRQYKINNIEYYHCSDSEGSDNTYEYKRPNIGAEFVAKNNIFYGASGTNILNSEYVDYMAQYKCTYPVNQYDYSPLLSRYDYQPQNQDKNGYLLANNLSDYNILVGALKSYGVKYYSRDDGSFIWYNSNKIGVHDLRNIDVKFKNIPNTFDSQDNYSFSQLASIAYDSSLSEGSPAMNIISADYPPYDYLGNDRPEPGGTKADIGAYEANSSGGPPIITSLPLSITAYVDTDIVITPTVVNATSYKWDKVSPTDPITLSNPELLVNHPTSDTPTGKANGSNGYQIKFTATNDKGSSEKTITIYIYKRADIDGSGTVDSADFFALLGQWGKTDKDNMANVDLLVTKGVAVDSADFFYLLGKWGK